MFDLCAPDEAVSMAGSMQMRQLFILQWPRSIERDRKGPSSHYPLQGHVHCDQTSFYQALPLKYSTTFKQCHKLVTFHTLALGGLSSITSQVQRGNSEGSGVLAKKQEASWNPSSQHKIQVSFSFFCQLYRTAPSRNSPYHHTLSYDLIQSYTNNTSNFHTLLKSQVRQLHTH